MDALPTGLPDAQKVAALSTFGDRQVAFESHFFFEDSRKVYPLLKEATNNVGAAFAERLLMSKQS